jgi:hypothetical protein
MAKKRIIFEGNNVKYFPISNVGGDQFKAQAAFQGNLADRINNVLKFSIGKVETESKIKAYEYAAANPISFSQYQNASPQERTELLPKGTNVYNSTLRNAQINFLATDVAMAASKKISELELNANNMDMDVETFEAELNSIVDGYTQSFLEIDGEGAVTVKAKLATMAHSSLNGYYDKKIKQAKDIKDATVKDYAGLTINEVGKIIQANGAFFETYDDVDGVVVRTSVDEHLEKEKNRIKLELLIKGYNDTDGWSADWDAEVVKQKQMYLDGYYITPDVQESVKQANDMYDQAESGNFGGNQNMQEIYKSLDNKEKDAYLDKVEEWKDGVANKKKDRDEALAIDQSNLIKNTNIKFHEAIVENDYEKAVEAVNDMKDIPGAGDAYIAILKDFETKEEGGAFTDPLVFDKLEEMLIMGTITNQDIDEAYATRDITAKQRSDFKLAKDKRLTSTFKEADAYLKKAIGYEDTRITIGDSEEKNLAFDRYRAKSIELYEYFINTPDVTASDLIAQAKEIVGTTTASQDLKAKIITTRAEIKTTKYGQFTMNSNAMFVYAKKVGLTEAKTKSEFDNLFTTVEGVSTIISVLDSILLIPEGGEVNIEGTGIFGSGVMEDTISRPLSITNDNIDILRSKLLAYQTLLTEDQQ